MDDGVLLFNFGSTPKVELGFGGPYSRWAVQDFNL
jgi:hypothetical protein